jgi:hypothetical protein
MAGSHRVHGSNSAPAPGGGMFGSEGEPTRPAGRQAHGADSGKPYGSSTQLTRCMAQLLAPVTWSVLWVPQLA